MPRSGRNPAGDTAGHRELDRAHPVGPVRAPARGEVVGDEDDPATCRPEGEPDRFGREVTGIGDHPDRDVVAGQCRAHDAGVAVGERPHRVEEVGDQPGAAVERGIRLGGRRVAVPAGDADPAAHQEHDQFQRPGQLRRQRHLSDRPGGQQPFGQLDVRGAQQLRRVGSGPFRGQERPLQVDAQDPCAARARPGQVRRRDRGDRRRRRTR